MKLRLDHPLWQRWAPAGVRRLMELWFATCRLEKVAHKSSRQLMESPRPVLFTSWHCHLLTTIMIYWRHYSRYAPMALMASPSRDGEFISELARGWKFAICAGSRQKGGVAAVKGLAGYIREGYRAGLIADGSRGPAREVQKGVLFVARETQVPIIPAAIASSRKITLNTWDRFELPLPFCRMAMLIDEPFYVPAGIRGQALENLRQDLEARLNRLFLRSQTYFSS